MHFAIVQAVGAILYGELFRCRQAQLVYFLLPIRSFIIAARAMMSQCRLLALAAAVRIILLVVADWQDRNSATASFSHSNQ